MDNISCYNFSADWHKLKYLLHFYLQAAKYVEFDHAFTDDEKSTANALWLSCNLNSAACKLKLGEYLEASKLCTKVLSSSTFLLLSPSTHKHTKSVCDIAVMS